MRILGIDPGLNITGYACVELEPNRMDPKLIEAGVFRLGRGTVAARVARVYEDLAAVLDELKPERMIVERLFAHYRHGRTAMLMGHARGVVLLAGAQRGIEIDELVATEVKKAFTGNGHASKSQVQHAVMAQFGLKELPEPPDVADAIAIATSGARRLVLEA